MLFKKSAGAIVFYRSPEGKVEYLLLRHKGYWHFPKGGIEKGEKAIETARREIIEETGLSDFEQLDGFKTRETFIYRTVYDSDKIEQRGKIIIKTVIFYLVQVGVKDIKTSSEHIGYEWLSYELALDRMGKFKSSQAILKKANRFLGEHFSDQSL